MTSSDTLILVDGSGFIFRAYHALPPLSRPDGTPVGAVYGFCTMLHRLLTDYPDSPVVVVFDTARKTFRHDIFPLYKSHRPEPPEDLIPQFPLVRQAVAAFGLPSLEMAGYEADDIIATLTRQARIENRKVHIVSSDKDLMQLVGEGVFMIDTLKNRVIGVPEVQEKFGVMPEKVRDILALTGDSSDFVPGVPGIGPKTAAELITTYGSLENLYEHAHEIKQNKRRENILDNRDNAFISQRLVTLMENVPLEYSLNAFKRTALDPEPLKVFLQDQGFKTLMTRMLKPTDNWTIQTEKFTDKPQDVPVGTYHLIQKKEILLDVIDRARQQGHVAIDTETTSLNPLQARLVGISLALTSGQAYYIPISHVAPPADLLTPVQQLEQLELALVVQALKPLLMDPGVLKIGHNLKYDMHVLSQVGLEICGYDDTMIMSYVLYGGSHGHSMDELASRYLSYTTMTFKEVVGSGRAQKTFDHVSLDQACRYAAEDADITLRLWAFLKEGLREQHLNRIYYDLDQPMVSVLKNLESEGIYVDALALHSFSQELEKALNQLESDIHSLAGKPFNVASPKQLADILFEDMGLSSGRKGKSGQKSTGIDVLEELAAEGHMIAISLIKWRQLAKLKSTYTDALIQEINPNTGRVHTSFALTIANTGRLSSSSPNLQNIPVRTPEGLRIRDAFKAPPGTALLSMDYSQIELRLLAHCAGIPSLQHAFLQDHDIHRLTASEVLHVPLDQVTSDQRRQAKAINFGIIYGISAFGLAAQLGISRHEAGAYIQTYKNKYPGIVAYMESLKEEARAQGFVTTLWGRRCYIPGIHDKNAAVRGFAERQAINAPLQGTAADLIKRAMIELNVFLKSQHPQIKMVLQVHDELIFEVPENIDENLIKMVQKKMESVISLKVPLKVDYGLGKSWATAHG